jgi:adenylate kinase family enzyme
MNIILLSPPGGGKGTLAEQIIQKYNYLHITLEACLEKQKMLIQN